jgi:pimeloyl-ACP methyl ester carboxylesterase
MAIRKTISFTCGDETLVGDLVLPESGGPHPALLMVAGTGAQDRHGTIFFPSGKIGRRTLRRWMSERLASEGIASYSWDKRGVGESTGGPRQPGDPPGNRDMHTDVWTDIDDAEQALLMLHDQPEINRDRVAVMGHSAGVYFASLLAARTTAPALYVFLGGVHSTITDFMDYIYGELEDLIAIGPEEKAWMVENHPYEVQFLQYWRDYKAAAFRGDEYFELEIDGEVETMSLARLKQEIEYPLSEQFRHVKKPVLILHGDRDVNVRVEEAFKVEKALKDYGNDRVTLVIVPMADHSMNVAPKDLDHTTRTKERLSQASHSYPYSEFFLYALIGYLKDWL